MASGCLPLRNSAFPDSRSLVICADRFGLTGIGGGGTRVSMPLRDLWSSLRAVSSSCKARELEVDVMAFVVASIEMGSNVKLSESSMMTFDNVSMRGFDLVLA